MTSTLADRHQVVQAVDALKSYVAKISKQKKNLLNPVEMENIHLQLSCKKVSIAKKTLKILLPHYFVDSNTSICLFARDEDREDRDYSVTVDTVRQHLENAGVSHSIEVIPLKQLKLEYKEYESKRNLLAMYDIFLADERIVRLLPAQLGKAFYKRKRFPVPVNLTLQKNMGQEIDRALRTAQCVLTGQGCSSQVTVGRVSQATEEIVDNIVETMQRLSSSVPGGQLNIRSIHVKVQDSPSVPIFISLGSKVDVELNQEKRQQVAVEPEDVTTVVNGKVLVTANCSVRFISDKSKAVEIKSKVRGGKGNSKAAKKLTSKQSDTIPTLVPAAVELVEPKVEVKQENDDLQLTAESQKTAKRSTKRKHEQSANQPELVDCKKPDDLTIDSSKVQKTKTREKAVSKAMNKQPASHQKLVRGDRVKTENNHLGEGRKQSSMPKAKESKEPVKTKRSKANTAFEPAKKKQKLHP